MNPPQPSPTASAKRRSRFVTVLAWLTILIGLLGSPISVITRAMIVVQSYGTQTSDPMGFFIIVLGPAILLTVGFGLLRRKWWARGAAIALLAVLMASYVWPLIRGPRPTTIDTSASGVKTTFVGSDTDPWSLPVIALCICTIIKLCSAAVRAEFASSPMPKDTAKNDTSSANDHRGWRVGHRGRDMIYYEENISGTWQRIDIDGEMLMGRAHHVIHFASAERWQSYPEWARHRRSEIIARIQGEFREPDYEYHLD